MKMAPDPGGRCYTVGVSFERLIPDERHKTVIRDAVERVHKATIYATELVNIHIRRCFQERSGKGIESVFDSNWLYNVYNEVTSGKGSPKVVPELRESKERFMPDFVPVDRTGLLQILLYECRNLATVASNNVWMHFQKRILDHVRHVFRMEDKKYNAMTKESKRQWKLTLLQVANDLSGHPSDALKSPTAYHKWIALERSRLGINNFQWSNKPLLYHLKAHPEQFLKAMWIMNSTRHQDGGKTFSIYPLRRSLVPRHIRIDQQVLRSLFGLGQIDYHYPKRRKTESGSVDVTDIEVSTSSTRTRRSKADMVEEKSQVFSQILDLHAAKLRRRHHFDFSFTTDGVCARLKCMVPSKKSIPSTPTSMPHRGIHSIDTLKHLSRIEDLHVIGIDPGIREIIVAVDQDNVKGSSIRYTQKQRLRELRSRQYQDEGRRTKPYHVTISEEDTTCYNSYTTNLFEFCNYCRQRHERLDDCLMFYRDLQFRRRRWKTAIKEQKSEQRLFERLGEMHKRTDPRTMVLAYGAWGATTNSVPGKVKRGNPPTIGVGIMRKLAKRFVVSLTPEFYTSQSCCRCLGKCGPWTTVEERMKKKLRGLRICQDESCKLPQNRDHTGASNIGLQFKRLFSNQGPIRQMTDEDREFHRLEVGLCEVCE